MTLRIVGTLAALLIVGCASTPPPGASSPAAERVPNAYVARVTVTPEASGTWLVEYAFAQPEATLIFSSSGGDYRRATWVPLDDGVRLVREGAYDTILLDRPSTRARFRVTPYSDPIDRVYTPALAFSDGGRAVHVGQFEILRVQDAETAATLRTLRDWVGEYLPFTFVLDTDAPIIAGGERIEDPARFDSREAGYVYYGPGNVTEGQSFIGVVDSGLPEWIRRPFDADLGAIFSALEDGFGSPLPSRVSVLFAFGGLEHEGVSFKGDTLPGSSLQIDGSGALLGTPSPVIRAKLMWLFAHEATHLFQGREVPIRVARPWVHEGHANLVAHLLVPENAGRYEANIAICRRALESSESLAAALDERPYECGASVWSLADRLTPETDVYSLWDRMAEAAAGSRASAEHFLSVLRTAGADGPEFDAFSRALRGDDSVDTVALLLDSTPSPEGGGTPE